MPQRQTRAAAQTRAAQGEGGALASTSLRVVDHSGHRRRGSVTIMPRRSSGPIVSAALEEGEDFRIIMMAEPPDGPAPPAEGVVVIAPARPLPSTSRLREPAAVYGAARQAAI